MTIKEMKKIAQTMVFYMNQTNYARANGKSESEEIYYAQYEALEFVFMFDFNCKVERIVSATSNNKFAGVVIRRKDKVFYSKCLSYSINGDNILSEETKDYLTAYGIQDAENIYDV